MVGAMPSDVRRTGRLVLLLVLAVYLATTGGSMATDVMSYEVTKAIVERGSVAMTRRVLDLDAHRGVDGRYYAPYGIGHAVYSIPFYVAAREAERWTGLRVGRSEAITKAGFVVGSAVASAVTVWIAFLFAWRLCAHLAGAPPRAAPWRGSGVRLTSGAVTTALALAFGTLLWPYAKFGFSAPLATLCALAGTCGIWVGVRGEGTRGPEARGARGSEVPGLVRSSPRFEDAIALVLGGAGLGGALLVRHELALLCLPAAGWIVAESWPDRRAIAGRGLLAGLPVVVAVVVTLFYNDARFGNPFDTGYLRDDTVATGSLWDGLTGLLVSPGRSLFLYSPVLIGGVAGLVGLARSDRRTAALLGGQSLVLVLFYASLTHWDADRSYGPRYLLPVVPLLLLPLAPWIAGVTTATGRRLVPALVGLSTIVQLPGVLVDFSKVGFTREVGPRTLEERRWSWAASGLVLNTRASLAVAPENLRYLATGQRPPVRPASPGAQDFSDQFAFSFDFWWLYLFYLGALPARAALAIGAAGLAAAAFLAWRLRVACDDG
jgi:hypothetical protein